MKNLDNLIDKIRKIAEMASYFLGTSFVFGFIIWNTYLYGLGFKEDSILQTRFIFTGISFILITVFIWSIILYFPLKYIHNLKNLLVKDLSLSILIVLIIAYFLIYIFFIFTKLPIVLGGGRPRGLSIMADANELSYLANFGAGPIDKNNAQSVGVCVAYEGDKYIIVMMQDRILQINSDKLNGLVSLPGVYVGLSRECSKVAQFWITKTLSFEILSSQTVLERIIQEQNLINPH